MALYKKVDLIQQNQCDFCSLLLSDTENATTPLHCFTGNKSPGTSPLLKIIMLLRQSFAYVKKVDLIQQNQCDFCSLLLSDTENATTPLHCFTGNKSPGTSPLLKIIMLLRQSFAYVKKVDLIQQNQCDFCSLLLSDTENATTPLHCFTGNKSPGTSPLLKIIMLLRQSFAYVKKVDLIQQNQCDFCSLLLSDTENATTPLHCFTGNKSPGTSPLLKIIMLLRQSFAYVNSPHSFDCEYFC